MENTLNKSRLLEQDIIDFAVSVVKYVKSVSLPRPVSNQLIYAGISIGANYAEATKASSKTDFRNKIYIAKKESAKTRYWLRLAAMLSNQNLASNHRLTERSQRFLMILQKTVNTTNGQRKSKDQRINASKVYDL